MERFEAEIIANRHAFTAESFGDSIPENYMHICEELNIMLTEFIFVSGQDNDRILNGYCNDLWD